MNRPKTPDSKSTLNNAVFRTKEEIKTVIELNDNQLLTITIPAGTNLSLLACKQGVRESPYRFQDHTVYIDNRYMDYVWGNIGEKAVVTNEEIYRRIQELEDELAKLHDAIIETV